MPRHIVLEVEVDENIAAADIDWIREAFGECARSLEHDDASGRLTGLVPDPDDPGRFTWRSFDRVESYE